MTNVVICICDYFSYYAGGIILMNLHGKDCHKIDPDFIADLGSMYIFEAIRNTPQDEIARFTETYGYKFN